MVVDDEDIICQVTEEFLGLKGCQVMAFTNPNEAFLALTHLYEQLDVVVLDMLMPEMTGEEMMNKMIEIDPTVNVLFVSGFSEGIELNERNKKNIKGFIEKPVKLERLYEHIVGIINER